MTTSNICLHWNNLSELSYGSMRLEGQTRPHYFPEDARVCLAAGIHIH